MITITGHLKVAFTLAPPALSFDLLLFALVVVHHLPKRFQIHGRPLVSFVTGGKIVNYQFLFFIVTSEKNSTFY